MAFDPNVDLKSAAIRSLFTAANTKAAPVDRAATSSDAQDCAIALVQLGRSYSGQGVTIKSGGTVLLFGVLVSPKGLAAALVAPGVYDDVELVNLCAGMRAALEAAGQ